MGADGIAAAIAAVGVLIAVFTYVREQRRVERAREEAAFEAVTTHYLNFIRICMEEPDLHLSDLSGRFPVKPHIGNDDWERRNSALFEYFFQVLEKAYVLYRADERAERSGDFRARQWIGWQSWIAEYAKDPAVRAQWRALSNDRTYDSEFQNYMNALLAGFPETGRP